MPLPPAVVAPAYAVDLFHPAVSLECLLVVFEFSLMFAAFDVVAGNILLEAVLLCFWEAKMFPSLDFKGSISLPCLWFCRWGGE